MNLDGLKTNCTAKLPDDLALSKLPTGRRSRHELGKMNKLETAYAWELDLLLKAGKICGWWFEPFKVRLADRTWFTVDFLVQLADGALECDEVKGHLEDDAAAKFRIAREMYPCFVWRMLAKREGAFVEILKERTKGD